jgi:hypothetical protein
MVERQPVFNLMRSAAFIRKRRSFFSCGESLAILLWTACLDGDRNNAIPISMHLTGRIETIR